MAVRKILAVDDSPLMLQIYQTVCRRYRCAVITASNGVEALDQLSQQDDIDIILLDINMPHMDGLTFIEKRAEIEAFRTIPIIVVSTEGKEKDSRRALELGASAYLTKPFHPKDLHALIDRLFEKGAGADL